MMYLTLPVTKSFLTALKVTVFKRGDQIGRVFEFKMKRVEDVKALKKKLEELSKVKAQDQILMTMVDSHQWASNISDSAEISSLENETVCM